MKHIYKIVFENEIGVLLKTDEYDYNCVGICFVHHTSFEKYASFYKEEKVAKLKVRSLEDIYELIYRNVNKNTFGLKIKPEYIYVPKRENNNTIEEHASNLIECLKNDNVREIKLISISYGGLIAALASKYDIVTVVALFQSPLWGTPLADISLWGTMNKRARKYILKRYKKSTYLDDLLIGLKDRFDKVNLKKIIFIYGYSTHVKGVISLHNRKYWVPEIKRLTNMDNDAVVPFPSKEVINKIGFGKVIYFKNLYHVNTLSKKYHLVMLKEVKHWRTNGKI